MFADEQEQQQSHSKDLSYNVLAVKKKYLIRYLGSFESEMVLPSLDLLRS